MWQNRDILGEDLRSRVKPGDRLIIKKWMSRNLQWGGGEDLNFLLNKPLNIIKIASNVEKFQSPYGEKPRYIWHNNFWIYSEEIGVVPFSLLYDIDQYEIER